MLQRFMSKKQRLSEEDGEVEIELDLGLSLNGRFGVDPLAKTRLMRSSSVLDLVVNDRSGLSRTCSLPVETEEEWRKRKELQSLRRLEAKRKRSEKQRKQKACGGEEKVVEEGSIGSSGSGSSGLSEVDTLPPPVQATTNKSMETSPSTAQSQPENPGKEASRNIIEDMPCVSTTGDGPNGKKIDGFLYRYRKGEEVRIVCVCHGSFLSPAEFVKHAGGGDVAHPLKHIVVNPSPFL
ncbi:putative nuclear localization signal [Arabidopsis suecica]|uniref:Ninja-family protein n=1 Tax=Arabidopsis suecica TaxID=45249 RepID=A0A8T1ZVY3_ARASU|nr:putative nuclear localization signal [Arabidopsis suecica]